jgi:hypothetical protein
VVWGKLGDVAGNLMKLAGKSDKVAGKSHIKPKKSNPISVASPKVRVPAFFMRISFVFLQ